MFTVDTEKLDKSGRMRVWKLDTGEWIYHYPVDVIEMMARGAVALEKPEDLATTPTPARRGRPPKANTDE